MRGLLWLVPEKEEPDSSNLSNFLYIPVVGAGMVRLLEALVAGSEDPAEKVSSPGFRVRGDSFFANCAGEVGEYY
jgi:hypothetical protein